MPEAAVAKRRGRGEDAIYFASAKNRYVGSISLGYRSDGRRIRKKVFGQTKQEVRDKLKALHAELDAGIKSSPTYTIVQAVEDWLRDGLDGRSDQDAVRGPDAVADGASGGQAAAEAERW